MLPAVFHNPTAITVPITTGLSLQPGHLAIHPGRNDEFSVVRFTAPEMATFQLDATFELIDQQASTTDVHIFAGGSEILAETLSGFSDSASLSTTVAMVAGDTLDFTVGIGNCEQRGQGNADS